ncbi:PAS domain-containing sensor histidine kinase [Poriferisphaera sp. WC338]|uniref:PAS domain-containing sensor histidine kinase n=1 Tax=Poriferisphaera sp. WC338 TaxID=3425129 RepID=UPI003D818C45
MTRVGHRGLSEKPAVMSTHDDWPSALSDGHEDWRETVFRHLPAIVMAVNAQGVILDMNNADVGITREAVCGQTVYQWIDATYLEIYRETLAEVFQTSELHRLIIRDVNGKWWWVSMGPVIEYQSEPVVNILTLDVTDQVSQEDDLGLELEQYVRVSKLMMAGQLHAAIAHEIRQPLTTIANYIDTSLRLLHQKHGIDKEDLEYLNRALTITLDAGKFAGELRSFLSRKAPRKTEKIDINDAICRAIRMLLPLTQTHHTLVRFELSCDIPKIEIDGFQLQQVLCNLITNAIDAFEEAGIENREIVVSTKLVDDSRICICVADTGPGVAVDRRDVLFKAFETSKSEGLGLGLWICRDILSQYGGEIGLDNSYENGACFNCYLPVNNAAESC